jgi:hypothetical protein
VLDTTDRSPSIPTPGFLAAGQDRPQDIATWVNTGHWEDWVFAYRPWWRQAEENIRMLSGRQWDQYIRALGDFVDISDLYASDDERWRKYPVFNWVAHYFKLTLAKITENVPVLGFMPTTPSEKDARLAQLGEPIWKAAWNRMEMPEQAYRLYGWVISCGRGVVKLCWDPDEGPSQLWHAPAVIHLAFSDGHIETRALADAPYTRLPDGTPYPHILNQAAKNDSGQQLFHPETGNVVWNAHPSAEGGLQFGPPLRQRLGDLRAETPAPVSIIVPHGPDPFHRKPWVCHEELLHVEEARTRFDKPDLEPEDLPANDLLVLKFSYATNYGMPTFGAGGTGGIQIPSRQALKDHVRIRSLWQADSPNEETLERGRLTIVTKDDCLYDDKNPYWVDQQESPQAILPFEAFDLIPYPFRQEGPTDLEILNPLNRATNRRMGGLMDAADYAEHSPLWVNVNAGVEEDPSDWNKPGHVGEWDGRAAPGGPTWREPPVELPPNSLQLVGNLREWMEYLGSTPAGSEGQPVPGTDPSGELIREKRFDTDRVWGATLRLHSFSWARICEKMLGIYGACMSDERMFVLAGEDQGWDFFTLKPQLFDGSIHVVPNPESPVLESRQDKQNRILDLAQRFPPQAGGPPVEHWLDLLGYPDLRRLTRPGGPAWEMAERENLELLLGSQDPNIPFPMVLPEQDHATHISVHQRRMQTVAYRDAGLPLQLRFRAHVALHQQFQAQAMAAQVRTTLALSAAHTNATAPPKALPSGPSAPSPSAGSPTTGPTPA